MFRTVLLCTLALLSGSAANAEISKERELGRKLGTIAVSVETMQRAMLKKNFAAADPYGVRWTTLSADMANLQTMVADLTGTTGASGMPAPVSYFYAGNSKILAIIGGITTSIPFGIAYSTGDPVKTAAFGAVPLLLTGLGLRGLIRFHRQRKLWDEFWRGYAEATGKSYLKKDDEREHEFYLLEQISNVEDFMSKSKTCGVILHIGKVSSRAFLN